MHKSEGNYSASSRQSKKECVYTVINPKEYVGSQSRSKSNNSFICLPSIIQSYFPNKKKKLFITSKHILHTYIDVYIFLFAIVSKLGVVYSKVFVGYIIDVFQFVHFTKNELRYYLT